MDLCVTDACICCQPTTRHVITDVPQSTNAPSSQLCDVRVSDAPISSFWSTAGCSRINILSHPFMFHTKEHKQCYCSLHTMISLWIGCEADKSQIMSMNSFCRHLDSPSASVSIRQNSCLTLPSAQIRPPAVLRDDVSRAGTVERLREMNENQSDVGFVY